MSPLTASETSLGPLVLGERLARGGMAEVCAAVVDVDVEDETLRRFLGREGPALRGREVAVKRLAPDLLREVDFVEMFRDEARLALSLRHPGVVRTFALIDDVPAGTPTTLALVMERVRGRNLARVQSRLTSSSVSEGPAPLSCVEALAIGHQLAEALHAVHSAVDEDTGQRLGIVHRDVSPHNVMLALEDSPLGPAGRVVLIDFGVARAAARLTRTRNGVLKGKAAYMAPEHVRGEAVDARADQFSLGVVLWELLCRRPLFSGPDELHVLNRVRVADVLAPSTLLLEERGGRADVVEAGVDVAAIDRVLLTMLDPMPERRYPSCAAAAVAVQALLPSLEVGLTLRRLAQRVAPLVDEPSTVAPAATRARERTRVINAERAEALMVEETAPPVSSSEQRAGHPLPSGVLGLGALGVVGVAALAGLWSTSTTAPTPQAIIAVDAGRGGITPDGPVAASTALAAVEQRLESLPSHPCRTELLDELRALPAPSASLLATLQTEAEQCAAAVKGAQRAADTLAAIGTSPPLPRRPSRRQWQRYERTLQRRGELALAAGAREVAVRAYEILAGRRPDDAEARRQLFEAYRRDGRISSAGVEARALLRLLPNDPVSQERYARWLRAHDLPISG